MRVVEPGHIYELPHLESEGHEVLRFIRRSSGAIDYGQKALLLRALSRIGDALVRLGHWLGSLGKGEHPGTNTQAVIRALIDRTEYLYYILPAVETADAAWYLRMALFCYEARAWRRKQQGVNKGPEISDFEERYGDVPFNEQNIEELPVGPDGHILSEVVCPTTRTQ